MDAVTFEVIRHRLWAINDEQGRMAARLSGSPVVYEARDFNAALTTADGRGLITGVYILHQGATVDAFVQRVLADWPAEEIREGDMFFSNDPGSGALHANDGIVVMPIFWDGSIVTWAGVVMHDNDVGGPVPGSFVYGARDRFGEAPLFPDVKIAEGYRLRQDVLGAYLRNSRTPESNAVNMHARVAALTATRSRIHDLIARYGIEEYLAALEGIIEYVERVLAERLRDIPDGEWFAEAYHDHDTINDRRYSFRCRLTKRDAKLTLDMTGTAPQADGPINCRWTGMEAAVHGVLFTYLCHDLPWATGGLRPLIEIVAEQATINNADETAPVSMASLMAIISTQDVVADVCAKMLMSSASQRDEAQATWAPIGAGGQLIGADSSGRPFFGHLMEGHGGGGGARTFEDGVDSGGIFHSMACTLGNVETFEGTTRVLYLYRRELCDGGGPGRFRGGVPVEFAVVPHGCAGPCITQTLGSSFSVPGGRGLSGGAPGAAARISIRRGTDYWAQLASGRLPTVVEDLSVRELEALPAKARTMLGPDDVLSGTTTGGAGYGDPLRRDPALVLRDVRDGLVSPQMASQVYGVTLQDDAVDERTTAADRDRARELRVTDSVASNSGPAPVVGGPCVELLHPVSDTVEAVRSKSETLLRCTICHRRLAGYDEDHKALAAMRERPVTTIGPHNGSCSPEYVLREYSCSGCGTLLAMDVQGRDEAALPESRFGQSFEESP